MRFDDDYTPPGLFSVEGVPDLAGCIGLLILIVAFGLGAWLL